MNMVILFGTCNTHAYSLKQKEAKRRRCFKHSPLQIFSLMVKKAEQWRHIALPNKWDKADTHEKKETHWWLYLAHRCFYDMLALIKSIIIYLIVFIPHFSCTKKIGIIVVHAVPLQIFNKLRHHQFPVKTTNFYLKLFRHFFPINNPLVLHPRCIWCNIFKLQPWAVGSP